MSALVATAIFAPFASARLILGCDPNDIKPWLDCETKDVTDEAGYIQRAANNETTIVWNAVYAAIDGACKLVTGAPCLLPQEFLVSVGKTREPAIPALP